MSALAQALAQNSSNNTQVVVVPATMAPPSPASSASLLSSSPSCSSLSSSSTRSTCSDNSVASTSSAPQPAPLRLRVDPTPRPNEHLAVLLPRHLWKADSSASHCDNFYCRVPFSIFERRHHCRKCGGVYCAPCTERSTPLLDASNLAFLHPPRNTPLAAYESPESPIITARVCDDCFDQIHGSRTPDVPARPIRPTVSRANSLLGSTRTTSLLSSPISLFKSPRTAPSSAASSPPLATPPQLSVLGSALPLTRHTSLTSSAFTTPSPSPGPAGLSRTRPSSRATSPRLTSTGLSRSATLPSLPAEERSYGELDAYPLRRSSVLCKAAGGGRWEPKHTLPDPGERVPVVLGEFSGATAIFGEPLPLLDDRVSLIDGHRISLSSGGSGKKVELAWKAPYELEMEREEAEERRRRRNPVVRDGDFQYRFPSRCGEGGMQEEEGKGAGMERERAPMVLSTF
ncbi:FYVE zinc finger-domain-containing protein [Mycena crocata]|nr:FYVE zinc finger-domain-containing protein [Mycena crocata]